MSTLNKLMAGESVSYADLLQEQHAAQLATKDAAIEQMRWLTDQIVKRYDAEVARLTAENERLRKALAQYEQKLCETCGMTHYPGQNQLCDK